MKRFFLLAVALMLGIMLSAQPQQGYVKTKGRLANDGSVIAGTRIPNATIQVKDRTPVVSQANGTFSFPIPASKFYLQNVQKQGYVLTDPDILSKEYIYSTNDLVLVMETPTDQWQDKYAAEKAMQEQLQRQVDEQRLELDSLKEQQRISDEEYRERLQRIFQLYDENDKLVNEMAERYAKIDYDQLDDYNRQIRQFILAGELKKADSLIHSKGNIDQRIDDLHSHQEANAKETETLAKRQEQLEAAKAGTQKELEDIAQDCYNMFEICKMQHLNDSAAHWIELRASLDTTNVDWLNDAGHFIAVYLSDFNNAIGYHQRALKQAKMGPNDNNIGIAKSYNMLGLVYYVQQEYDKALGCFQNALEAWISVSNGNNEGIATSHHNIGLVLSDKNDFDSSKAHLNKALEIRELIYGQNHPETATVYNTLGGLFTHIADYTLALDYYEKALKIRKAFYGEIHPDVASCYNNIGWLYSQLPNYEKSLEYYQKSLEIDKTYYGVFHPSTAVSCCNVAASLDKLNDQSTALLYHQQALSIQKRIFGENNIKVGITLVNIGFNYIKQGNLNNALEQYLIALSIFQSKLGENHRYTADAYDNIGCTYYKLGENALSLEYLTKALETRKIVFGESHPDVALSYSNLGGVYIKLGNYPKALECCENAYNIDKVYFGEDHPYTIDDKKHIEEVQAKLKEQEDK